MFRIFWTNVERHKEERRKTLECLSTLECLDVMKETQKSMKMQLISFGVLFFLMIGFLFVSEIVYKKITYAQELSNLQEIALSNITKLSRHINTDEMIAAIQEGDGVLAMEYYNKFNLYSQILGADYVYLMIQKTPNTPFISFSTKASPNIRGSVLTDSRHPFRIPYINNFPEALFDHSYWDDVTDYTKPGPLEAMEDREPNVSAPIVAHPRWGNLISAQAPVYYRGEVVGILGVGYSTDTLLARIDMSWRDLNIILLLVGLILLVVRTILTGHMNYTMIQRIVRQKYVESGVFALKVNKGGEGNDVFFEKDNQ